jgi:hypothetical protein
MAESAILCLNDIRIAKSHHRNTAPEDVER